MKVLFVLSVVLCAYSAQYLPPNPCPELFKYVQEKGTTFGVVKFENDLTGDYTLHVNMSLRAYLTNNESLKLDLTTSFDEILHGGPLTFHIYFPVQDVIPRPTEIKFNGRVYCTGPPEEITRVGVTSMWSGYFLKYPEPIKPGRRPEQQYPPTFNNSFQTTERPFQPQVTTSRSSIWILSEWPIPISSPSSEAPPTTAQATSSPTPPSTKATSPTTEATSPTTEATSPTTKATTPPGNANLPSKQAVALSSEDEDECGLPFIQHLIVGGDVIEEGQFPWMVAIMYSKHSNYTYRCTGSLVSKKHVVSAGHCMLGSKGPVIPFSNILLVLGKVDIENWAKGGAVTRGVENVVAHPDYKPNRGDADLAVLIMDQAVPYGEAIRPICLWEDAADLNIIVGREGTVAGWGKDESGKDFVNLARKIVMPVLSQDNCVKFNRGLKRLTSNRTFCGGKRDGTGPCTGDSGAGFGMLENGRWYLRGVVSSSLENGIGCNLDDYFIFADAAKFVGWLQSVMF